MHDLKDYFLYKLISTISGVCDAILKNSKPKNGNGNFEQ